MCELSTVVAANVQDGLTAVGGSWASLGGFAPADCDELWKCPEAREVHQLADEIDVGFGFRHGLAPLSGR